MKDSKGEEAEEPGGEREPREKSEKDSEDRGQFAFCFIFASWHTCEMHLGDSDRANAIAWMTLGQTLILCKMLQAGSSRKEREERAEGQFSLEG